MSIGSQDNGGTGVSIAGYPSTVNSKQHEHHQQGDYHDALNVHPDPLLLRLVLLWLAWFPDLSTSRKIYDYRYMCTLI